MKILMLTAYFPPEIGSASHLFFDMGREFIRRGHRITVLTGYPTYHVDASKLDARYQKGWWMKEEMEGMSVVRARSISMSRSIPVLRGIHQVTTSIVYALSGLFLSGGRPDLILIYSPPLFLGMTGLFFRTFKGAKAILNVQDLFPQSAIDLGLLRNPLLIRALRSIESYLYSHMDAVTVHSPGNREHVVGLGGRETQTYVVPNVIDTKALGPGPRNNAFRRNHGIPESTFLVSFAGVLGYSQDLDTVINAAAMLQNHPDLVVYIVGDGVEKERLVRKAEGIGNVRFLPMLQKGEYIDLLHASDVCLATLRSQVKTPVVPSKILSIMAAGRPVVAAMDMAGDAPRLIDEAQCGTCVDPERPQLLAEAIALLAKQPTVAESMGMKGRKYVEEHFSMQVCTTLYETIFNRLVEPPRITTS